MDDDCLPLNIKLVKHEGYGVLLLSYEGPGFGDNTIKVADAPLMTILDLKKLLADILSSDSQTMAAEKLQLKTESSGVLDDVVCIWEVFCKWHSDLDDSGYAEDPLDEWRPLVEGQSQVRIMKDPVECREKCEKVGACWSENVVHMNGHIFTVTKNLPPDKYLVYDPICHSRNKQRGRIYLPHDAICAVMEPQLVATVSSVQRDCNGALQIKFTSLAGGELASVSLDNPSNDVACLRAALAKKLHMEAYLVKLLSADAQCLGDSQIVKDVLGGSISDLQREK